MDALLEAIGNLFKVFKDPLQVFMLLIIIAEGVGIWKLVRFFLDRTDKDMEARVKLATAMEGLTDIIKEGYRGKNDR
jgi:hypothetical protein